MEHDTCAFDWCFSPVSTRGFCSKHYHQLWRLNLMPAQTTEMRFWAKVDKNGPISEYRPDLGPCWLWTAGQNGKGYGIFTVPGRNPIGSHCFAYTLLVGPIPDKHDVDHLCRVTLCCRPTHLEPVTRAVNIARSPISRAGVNAAKTRCPREHDYTPENTFVDKKGRRSCKVCLAQRARARNAAKTHCSKNHAYTYENTWLDKSGRRHCRRCMADTVQARREAKERARLAG